MKKLMIIVSCLMVCLFFTAPAALADTEGEAIAHAQVQVIPNITVTDPVDVDMGDVQTGLVCGIYGFTVHSNLQDISLQVIATLLYKGNEPTSIWQIPVATSEGVTVDPTCANPQDLPYLGPGAQINGLDSEEFQAGSFFGGDDGSFSCGVDVEVCWDQVDPELPEGPYSGFVKLYASLI